MKIQLKLFSLFLMVITNVTVKAQDEKFIIRGIFEGDYHGYIYLKYDNKYGAKVKDSVMIENGKFNFEGQVNCYIQRASLRLSSTSLRCDEPNAVCFGLDNSIVDIKLAYNQFQKIQVKGVLTSVILKTYLQRQRKFVTRIKEYKEKQIKLSDFDSIKTLEMKINKYSEKLFNMDRRYWRKKPNSNISPFLIARNSSIFSDTSLVQVFNSLSTLQQNSYYGLLIKKEIKGRQKLRNLIGTKAPSFKTRDVSNNIISLDNIYKDKIVLLDFWASWCIPCRASHPNLVSLYKKYKNKGFEIIGIAANDHDEMKWREAIKKDNLEWINILSIADAKLMGLNNIDIGANYMITEIPIKILIDKNGTILGRYDGNEEKELDKKLKEIFSNK